jgi:hypothetical protein
MMPIKLSWTTNFTLGPDQFFEITLRYTHQGTEVVVLNYVQDQQWSVERSLYQQADQETNGAYRWRVRAVQRGSDPAGKTFYFPVSYPSDEWVFYWQ